MRTETGKKLEEASELHQWAQARLKALHKGVSSLYDSKLSQSIVAGMRDAYRRIFEEGYFGRTIHDVVSYYNNGERGKGDDLPKQNDKAAEKSTNQHQEIDNGISM